MHAWSTGDQKYTFFVNKDGKDLFAALQVNAKTQPSTADEILNIIDKELQTQVSSKILTQVIDHE